MNRAEGHTRSGQGKQVQRLGVRKIENDELSDNGQHGKQNYGAHLDDAVI
jgi:hypothetical protein